MTTSPSTARPPAQLILSTTEHFVAFGFGAGLSPWAPGTMGTLVAIPVFLAMSLMSPTVYAIAVAVLFIFGCWVCGESARLLGVHDYGGIVFDEIVGYLIAAAPLMLIEPASVGACAVGVAAAFVLFRVFDILKPWPIRWLDRRIHGGFGIMIDDVLAGVMAALLLWIALHFMRSM
ncbi:phosphatidylglycerophosphatase A [Sinimarinibacterium sp. CAU 1509]|uniref:phosphatidylglycerophosphatase A family protein n=1 Tax=Sinimarinibacterium sp. CAU 1509 TaxID=2562283 RepID=UPI0010ABC4EA|nr:phosphatidylglycerophosphatase A [Sinimarinibacterium sp. CAU 1509]TJY60869.1 phosphatidylglycerophosphatase A [Sinimarinibacterium sp. CAU 1509]